MTLFLVGDTHMRDFHYNASNSPSGNGVRV